jgi:TonB family protein
MKLAKIVPGKPAVQGSLDKEIIRRVVRRHRRELKYCYERRLKEKPDLEGEIELKFTIMPDGTVSATTVAKSTIGDDEVEKCVAKKVKRWVFPKPKGGGIVIVRYPFNFDS